MKGIIDSRRDGSSVDLVNSAGLACRGRGAQRPIDRGEDPDLPKQARCSITKSVRSTLGDALSDGRRVSEFAGFLRERKGRPTAVKKKTIDPSPERLSLMIRGFGDDCGYPPVLGR